MLGIILHHIHNRLQYSSPILSQVGYLATALFFFISGYGNHISLNKNAVEMRWLIKKFKKIYCPFLVTYVMYCLTLLIGYHDMVPSLHESVTDLMIVSLPNQVSWFPKIILVCFIVHWGVRLVAKNKNKQIFILFIVIFSLVIALWKLGFPSYWFNSVLCYPIGAWVSGNKELYVNTAKNNRYLVFGITAFMVAAAFIIARKYWFFSIVTAVLFCVMCFAFSYCFTIKTKYLSWIGSNSFEFYLFHCLCLQLFSFTIPNYPVIYTGCVLVCSIIIVYLYAQFRTIWIYSGVR